MKVDNEMIELPDFKDSFKYENDFFLSCKSKRMSKILAHYELYKMSLGLPGDIVECGVFKGVSFVRWAMFRDLFENSAARKIIGFDTFNEFPEPEYEHDKAKLKTWLANAGSKSISRDQLRSVLEYKGITEGIELVKGNILETISEYLKKNQGLRISLLNLDTDIYEPAAVILDQLYERIVPGGVLILDDYAVFPGENKAVEEFFANRDVRIEKLTFSMTPSYMIKNNF